eukprot:473169-Rhodomonas_salina.1
MLLCTACTMLLRMYHSHAATGFDRTTEEEARGMVGCGVCTGRSSTRMEQGGSIDMQVAWSGGIDSTTALVQLRYLPTRPLR